MNVKFWGAAGTVTGSMHLLELSSGLKVLLDCGLYQGRDWFADEYNTSFPCEPAEIDYLILSHAHIDHCGNIPQLVKRGFKGRIFSTHATYDICALMLADSAHIQEKDAEYENKRRVKKGLDPVTPIYTAKDVAPALNLFFTAPYDKWYRIDPSIEFMFRDAGHMLGSASVTMRISEEGKDIKLGFTGDIGRVGRPILKDPAPMLPLDYLICESTYGGKDHEIIPESEDKLLEIILHTCVKKKGKLIIPAFSVGRTQNIVHSLDKLENEGRLPHIPVFVDSPLAVNATEIFRMHPECFDYDLLKYIQKDPNPFGFDNLHYYRDVSDSKSLNNYKGPCVIISASGMMSAGRILHHLMNQIEDKKNTILVVGYCAKNTLGGHIVNGAKTAKIFGKEYKVKAEVRKLNAYSGHAGQSELYDFISNQDKLKKLFLVHGEPDRAEAFKSFLKTKGLDQVIIPARGESFKL